jgi:hypothetical protein
MRPRRADGVTRAALPDGEAVVQAPGRDRAVILNAVGDAVLSLCDGTRTAAAIAAILRESLAAPAGVDVDGDVARLVDELVAAGVLEAARASESAGERPP